MHKGFMFKRLTVLVGFCVFGSCAFAATTATWTFTSGASDITTPSSQINQSPYNAWGNTVTASQTVSSSTYTATAQGWSSTGKPGSPGTTIGLGSANANGIYTSVSNTSNPLQTAYLGVYSGGLGVNNRETAVEQFGSAPQHAISNEAGYDSALFSFSTGVTLTSVSLGYPGSGSGCTYTTTSPNTGACNSDIVVLEWTGSGTPNLSNTLYSSMNTGGSGWQLVGNITNAANSSSNPISGGTPSSYWLIGTYIPITGATTSDNYADFAKIASVTATIPPPGKAPEPGSAALSGLALGALVLVRRLRRKS